LNRPWDSQLIIGISANTTINNNGRGLYAGMNAFLPKPISLKMLSELDCSTEVVKRTRQLDELEGVNAPGCDDNTRGPDPNLPVSILMSEKRSTPITPQLSCLIATENVDVYNNHISRELESMGWNVAVVHDGVECLEMLKMHKWVAVLIEDRLAQLSGLSCVVAFRKWEALQAATERQNNIFLVCEGNIPSPTDTNSWIQPPDGCNGVLRNPVPWIDLQCMLMRSNVRG
jgi:CheY-like chemotaxis protein